MQIQKTNNNSPKNIGFGMELSTFNFISRRFNSEYSRPDVIRILKNNPLEQLEADTLTIAHEEIGTITNTDFDTLIEKHIIPNIETYLSHANGKERISVNVRQNAHDFSCIVEGKNRRGLRTINTGMFRELSLKPILQVVSDLAREINEDVIGLSFQRAQVATRRIYSK